MYQLAVRTTVRVLAGGALLMSGLLTLGGPARFATPSLATARLVPGGVYAWAALIGIAGATTWTGIALGWRRPVVTTGLALLAVWAAFLDLSLWIQVIQEPTTPLTGAVVYAMLTAVSLILYSAGHELHNLEGDAG